MTRATLISRIVFGLLLLATFAAFFAAQRLKRSDPLVYSVNVKRYVSPNADGLRDRARLRFRTKKDDVVSVEVIDRGGNTVRMLADRKKMRAGAQRFQWNGRYAPRGDQRGAPVPDGAYRIRITMHGSGRSFVPDKYFVVDTTPPRLTAELSGSHSVSVLGGRQPIRVRFGGVEPSRRVEFSVYRVRGRSVEPRPVAVFVNTRGKAYGDWDQLVGKFRRRGRVERGGALQPRNPCEGRVETRGEGRPAPVGSYVIVVRGCDAAGNIGSSSSVLPPAPGSSNGDSGVTLTGVQVAPPLTPAVVGTLATVKVAPPEGGYRWRLRRVGGETVDRGSDRGESLTFGVPRVANGLYELSVIARNPVAGDPGTARTPMVVTDRRKKSLLVVMPAIAWQATNPVDVNGDGFAETFASLPPGERIRVDTDRFLAQQRGTSGFARQEGALASFVVNQPSPPSIEYTTDFALAGQVSPSDALDGHDAVLFAGDERWITPLLGTALRAFVEQGGKAAFFAPDAFRRTVQIGNGELSGPSERRERDIFGEAIRRETIAPAPVVPFIDELGLLRGPTGQFTIFEQSTARAGGTEVLTSAGREAERPALIGYTLGDGTVIRVGAGGWQFRLPRPGAAVGEANVGWTMQAILAELTREEEGE